MAVARDTFHWSGVLYVAGTEVDDKAPVVAACPTLFDRAPAPVVEQATAAPGEKRTTTRSAAKKV